MEFDEETSPRGLDLPRLASAVYAHKRWILFPTLAALIGAGAFVATVKPRYTATSKVLLENGESYFTRPEKAAPDAGDVVDDLTVQSEAEAAKSPDVERKAMDKLRPGDVDEFRETGGMFAFLGHHDVDPEDRTLENFSKRVEIYPQTKTRVLIFEFSSVDRARAARGANALAQAFLESQQAAKDVEAKGASKWLSEQIDALRAKVATSESRVEELRATSGLLPGPNGIAVPAQQLSDISAQIANVRTQQSAATAKAAALRDLVRAGRLDDVGAVAGDDSLRRYAETRVTLKSQIAELGRTLLPGHPRMKELAGQLASLEHEIRVAAMKRVQGLEEDARIGADQVASLQQVVANQAKTVTSSDSDQVKLRELEIDAKTSREQLESYLTKYREALARETENASPANGRIISTAAAPSTPSFPKTVPTLILAPLAAFFVSLGLVVAKILLGDSGVALSRAPARTAETARARRLPFGIDPRPAAAEAPAAEALDDRDVWAPKVETFVDRLADTSDGESLPALVTAEGGAGALPVALTAARRLARRGATALVDLGPSPAWLPDAFSHESGDDGLSDWRAEPDALKRIAHRDHSSSLDIIPSGSGAIDAEQLSATLERLAETYAFVVVHAPDWRAPLVGAAVRDMAAAIVAAPAAEIAGVEARVRAAFADEMIAIKAIATGEPIAIRERAA